MENEAKVGIVRPEYGAKMLKAAEDISSLMDYMSKQMNVDRREVNSRANKALFDLAEKRGMSLWSLCYEVAPHWKSVDTAFDPMQDAQNMTMTVDYELELIPLRIDWQHGEGYWEKKYKDLKEQLKKLAEEKEE
jgi:hypothetical protein